MTKLNLTVSGGSGIEIAGKVFAAGASEEAPPVIPDELKARADRGCAFTLRDTGSYVYEFHVEHGSGKFTVTIKNSDSGKSCGTDDFDTADGTDALDLSFKVA